MNRKRCAAIFFPFFFLLPLNEWMNEYLYMARNDFSTKPWVTLVSVPIIVLLLWVMCVFPCWRSVRPGMYVNSHLFQHCWTSSCNSGNRGSLWVTSTSKYTPSGGRSTPCRRWRLTASSTSPRSVLPHLLSHPGQSDCIFYLTQVSLTVSSASPRSVLPHLLSHPGQSYCIFCLTQVSLTSSSTSPRSVLPHLLPHPGQSYLIVYLTQVSLTSPSTSPRSAWLFTVGLLVWVCWLSKLIAPAESSECFCFGFGVPLSHAFSTIVINAHSVRVHFQLLTWLDKVKQQPLNIRKTFQTLVHNGPVHGLTVCSTAASTLFCTASFTLDSVSRWKLVGHLHLRDRFVRGIFIPYCRVRTENFNAQWSLVAEFEVLVHEYTNMFFFFFFFFRGPVFAFNHSALVWS